MAAPPRVERHKMHFHRAFSWKEPARAATTANINLTNQMDAGDTIDGVVLAAGDRVLVKSQTAGAENGIYVVVSSTAFDPLRAYDFEHAEDIVGATVFVSEGTTNGNKSFVCTTNDPVTIGTTALVWADFATRQLASVVVVIDGGGAVITTGIKADIEMPFAGVIKAVRQLADQAGSIVTDIWKDTYANYPPTVADTITASAKPTISSAVKSQDTTLSGWTTAFAAGDIFRINVDSATTVQRVALSLTVERS